MQPSFRFFGAAFAAVFATATSAQDIAIVGGRADDPFFAKVKRGIDDAAMIVKAHGGRVTYLPLQTYDNIGSDAANLVRTAVGQGADGIAAPNWVPSAEDAAFRAAAAAGIPFLLYNAGGTKKAEELGGLNYVGTEDYTTGLAAGEYFGTHGAKNVTCVNTVPGAQNLEDRCRGVADGIEKHGGQAKQLPLPATSFGNPTAVAEAIKAALLGDNATDGVMTQGNQDADAAANAIMQAGAAERVMFGSFNLDQVGLDRIHNGTQTFVVDQQGYLQGFMAVFLLDAALNYAITTPTNPILTGPVVVDASNADAVSKAVEAGVR
jgi:simple sugar transport system substrate-binding protein